MQDAAGKRERGGKKSAAYILLSCLFRKGLEGHPEEALPPKCSIVCGGCARHGLLIFHVPYFTFKIFKPLQNARRAPLKVWEALAIMFF